MKLNNKYYILRHGEALSNVKSINSSWPEKFINPITKKGQEQVRGSLKKLIKKDVSFIFSSDLMRTKQTAQMAGKLLKINPKFDKRLREISFGSLNGTPNGMSFEELFSGKIKIKGKNKNLKKMETYYSVLKRVYVFLKEIDKKYKNKNILIVSHQAPLWILENRVNGFTLKEGLRIAPKHKRIQRGELRELN